ncbi:hypothetical protein DOA20_26000 [Salmonella enterica subsp. enterica serovar Newport]|nr:hypothetical protein [Salmonella enterica subsp. enterica serovar Newport]
MNETASIPRRSPVTENVVIYGDSWPVVSAVQSLTTAILPDSQCRAIFDLPSLIQRLTLEPQAVLILCLRPREHVFLFYALRQTLPYHPVLVISDEMFFNDRLMLRVWGNLPCMMHDELSMMVASQRLCELLPAAPGHYCPEKCLLTGFLQSPSLPAGSPEVPWIFHLEEPLMDYMSLLIYREMLDRKITPFRMRMLQTIWSGFQTRDELTAELDTPERKLWNEKHRLLTQLGMPSRLRDILYGTRFCSFQQRTAFIPPAEVENICSGVMERMITRAGSHYTAIIPDEAAS